MMSGFNTVLKKMKDFFKDDKVQNLIQNPISHRSHSKSVTAAPLKKEMPSLNLNKLSKSESQNKKRRFSKDVNEDDFKFEALGMMKCFTERTSEETAKTLEIREQEKSFKERLKQRRTMKSSTNLAKVHISDESRVIEELNDNWRRNISKSVYKTTNLTSFGKKKVCFEEHNIEHESEQDKDDIFALAATKGSLKDLTPSNITYESNKAAIKISYKKLNEVKTNLLISPDKKPEHEQGKKPKKSSFSPVRYSISYYLE